MNAIDGSIPLQAGNIGQNNTSGIDLTKMLSLAEIAQSMQQKQAIKNVFAKPGNMENGTLTQQGLTELYQTDPSKAIDIENAQESKALRAQQIQDAQIKRQREYFDAISEEATPLWQKYDGLLKSGTKPEDAARVMQGDWTAARKRLSGLPQDVLSTIPERFDSATLEQSITTRDRLTMADQARKDAAEKEREKHDRAMEHHAVTMEGFAANRPEPGDSKWQVMTDPTTNQQYRYNPVTAQATDLAGKPYTPGGAAKLGGGKTAGFTPEMGSLMGALAEQGVSLPTGFRSKEQQMALYQGILDRNPGKSPDDLAKMLKTGQIEFGAQKKETQTAAGVAGKVEVAQNEIDEFVPLVRKSAQAVPRGQFVPVTKLLQMKDEAISDPNLRALKVNINSVLNAYDMLASRGGTDVEKRKENRALLTSADSPEVLESALSQFQAEAAAAHRAAVKATKVPELENPSETRFDSLDAAHEAVKAGKLKDGQKVMIGGRLATWHDGD